MKTKRHHSRLTRVYVHTASLSNVNLQPLSLGSVSIFLELTTTQAARYRERARAGEQRCNQKQVPLY